jgi:glycosyltransferase involved in cell wall biosynthesis
LTSTMPYAHCLARPGGNMRALTGVVSVPSVSVGMPVFNGERYLPETLDSLLAQTFKDFELIICDNASTDSTAEICRRYAARDKRIRFTRNAENMGASTNYRRVFEMAAAPYFRWANSDDIFAPESLERCVEVLDRETSVVLVYPKTKLIDSAGEFIGAYDDGLDVRLHSPSRRFAEVVIRLGMVNVIYGLIRTEALGRTGLIRGFPGGDIPLVCELALYGQFWELSEFLFLRRMHPQASSSYKDDIERTQDFFDPRKRRWAHFPNWMQLLAHFGSVARAPVSAVEKTRLVYFLMHFAFWRNKELRGEVYVPMRQALRYGLRGRQRWK